MIIWNFYILSSESFQFFEYLTITALANTLITENSWIIPAESYKNIC